MFTQVSDLSFSKCPLRARIYKHKYLNPKLQYWVFKRGLRPLMECKSVALHGNGGMIYVIAEPTFRALETSCPSMFFVDKKACDLG